MSDFNRADWTVYANGIGGWDAWNGRTRTRVELVLCGYRNGKPDPQAFSEAVAEFERRLGPYYQDCNQGPGCVERAAPAVPQGATQ